MTNWRIHPLTIADQQQHLDHSEKLLQTIQPNDPPILYWSLANPTGLVLGFSQKEHSLNLNTVAALGIPIYRRRAGGTAVLVGPHLLDLDIILPPDHPLITADIIESYRWLGETWVTALQQLGVHTHLVSPLEARNQQARRKDPVTGPYEQLLHRACYGSLSPYEVVVDNRKVVGLCMIRRRTGLLLQAGIVLHWKTTQLAQILGKTAAEQHILATGLLDRATGLDSLLGRVVTYEEVIWSFEHALLTTHILS